MKFLSEYVEQDRKAEIVYITAASSYKVTCFIKGEQVVSGYFDTEQHAENYAEEFVTGLQG